MKVQRFIGINGREALGKVRIALGPEAMILSNRSVAEGIEILACSANEFSYLIENHNRPADERPAKLMGNYQDSTLPINAGSSSSASFGAGFGAAPNFANTNTPSNTPSNFFNASQSFSQQSNPILPNIKELMGELRAMRNSLETQIAEITWAGNQQKNPGKGAVLRELLSLGFSPSLARYLTNHSPDQLDFDGALAWARSVLVRNITTMPSEDAFLDKGGVYALVGPTGVGKTTTTAKLAARYVMRHGTKNLALITTDGYRIGAHEQLRIYGKILGVMVHSVKDEVDLRIALEELKSKHMVLIDTVGMSQRDQMVTEQISMLDGTNFKVKRLLCLNSTSNVETLNEVVNSYRGAGLEGCILTKLDEAALLSHALDVVIRHKLALFYIGTGQRVPEDLEIANAEQLIDKAFLRQDFMESSAFEDHELSALMSTQKVRQDTLVNQLQVSSQVGLHAA